jgi:hypothetical protein
MYADKQAFNPMQIGAVMGGIGQAQSYAPQPQTCSALQEAADNMDRAIGEAMSMAELLAERLSPILRPVPVGVGQAGVDKAIQAASPVVETINRQRSRVHAIRAQLEDLLNRAEV